MGFHLRKSFNFGGIRLNLSSSGIGFSTGIKGLRVGIDGKGRSYIGGGKGPVRYRKYIGKSEDVENTTHRSENFQQLTSSDMPDSLKLLLPKWARIALLIFLLPAELLFLVYGLGLLFTPEMGMFGRIFGLLCLWFMYLIPQQLFFSKNIKMIEYAKEAILAYNGGCFEDAAELFKQARQIMPKNADWRLLNYFPDMVYQCYVNSNQYQKALDYTKHFIVNNRREKIVVCYNKLEKWDELVTHLQKEYTSDERNEHPALVAMLGEAFLKLGQNEVALETMLTGPVRKRNIDDEMCAFRYVLGKCYEANGDKTNALKQYQKIYSYDVNYEDVSERMQALEM